jgi:hypothetical protein
LAGHLVELGKRSGHPFFFLFFIIEYVYKRLVQLHYVLFFIGKRLLGEQLIYYLGKIRQELLLHLEVRLESLEYDLYVDLFYIN